MKKLVSRLLTIGLMSFLVGCNAQTATTTSTPITLELVDLYNGEYIIGQPIDTEYFFYCSKRNVGTVTVTYKNVAGREITETVVGNTFWPSYTGDHVFKMTVGDKTITKTITVYDQKPTLNIDNYAYFTTPSDKIYYSDIYSEISCDYTPDTAYLEVEKVEWAPFNFDLNHGDYEFTEVESKAKYFDGSRVGIYRIYVDAINGNRSVSGTINAVISNNEKDGNENVLMREGKYCSNRVVIDSENDNVFMLPAARFNTASYVTLAKEMHNSDELAIKFKGKQIPTFGIFTQPNEVSGSFSPNSLSDGYLLSFEQRATHCYTVTRSGSNMEYKRAYTEDLYFGMDDLETDKYYLFTWDFVTRNDTPSASHPELPYLHVIHWKIQEIYNVGTPEESYSEPIFDLGSAGGWWDKYPTASGYTVFYSSCLQDITFEVVGL